MTRKALGRGLNALLGDSAEAMAAVDPVAPSPEAVAGLEQISVRLIDRSPFQPRRIISEKKLGELANSIRAAGVVQPVLLRRVGERYQLVAGERRWRAAQVAGLDRIPAVVREVSDRESMEIAVTENLLREDLSAVEVARGFEELSERFGYSHEQIAERVGVDRTTVTNALRLLKLPISIQMMVNTKSLSAGHARALLACESEKQQEELAARAMKEGLSVRQIERLAAAASRAPKAESAAPAEAPPQDANLRAAVMEMERTLGTKVKVVGNETSGKIEISYYSAQDLNRLYEWITRK